MDSKKAIIEKSRQAREERALAKKQEKAILTVQSVVRKFLVRCRMTKSSIDALESALSSMKDEDRDFKDCFLAIEEFLIVHGLKLKEPKNFEKHLDRIMRICKCITTSIMADCPLRHSYVGMVLQKEHVKTWTVQVQTLIRLSLRHCEMLNISHAADKDVFLVYVRLGLLMTEVSGWKQVVAIKQYSVLRVGLSSVTTLFLQHYHAHNAIRILGKSLFSHYQSGTSAQISELLITSVLTILSRISAVCKHSDQVMDQFCVYFLTIPAIVSLVSEYTPCHRLLFKDSMSIKLLNYLSLERNLNSVVCTLDFNKLLFLLANCIHIGFLDRDTVLAPKVRPNFVDVICQILNHLKIVCSFENSTSGSKCWHEIFGYIPNVISRCNWNLKAVKQQLICLWRPEVAEILFSTLMEVNSVASTVFTNSTSNLPSASASSSASHAPVEPLSSTSSITASSVPSVKSRSKASKLFRKAFPSLGASKATSKSLVSLDSLEMFHVSGVCRLYQLAKDVLSQCKVEMLCGITRLENILPHMLHFILLYASRDAAKFFTDLCVKSSRNLRSDLCAKGAKVISEENEQSWISDLRERAFTVFSLFCECTWYLTTILDDIEVYEQEKLFVMSDLQLLVLFLNQLCFNLIWTGSHARIPSLFTSVHSLLILLVERNYRRQFLTLDQLLIKEIKINNFMVEYEKNIPRAHLLIEKMPHVLPHDDRVLLFRRLVNEEKFSLGILESSRNYPKSTLITIRRNRVIEDGFDQLNSGVLSDANFKGLIRVKFVNEQGLMEAGIDQDGVFKEFLEESISKIFNPDLNLFKLTEDQKLYPSPTSSDFHDYHILLFEYVGRLLGKAVYEGIVVEVQFASFFLTQLLGSRGALYSCIDELPSLDEQLFRSLSYVKHYDGDVADLQLTFSCDEDEMGQVKTYELTPGGSLEPVTNSNKILYIHSMALFKMHTQIKKQSQAFNKGFKSIIKPNWMGMFSGPELQRLISGDVGDINLQDMRAHTVYYGGYHNSHKVIKWFWDILENDFSSEERSLLLKFCTSCSKPPLLGFSYLEPAFSIRRVEQPDDTDEGDTVGSIVRGFFSLSSNRRGGESVSRLPTSSTCFNLLKLPHYQRRATLRDKLRYALHSNVGFELS